MYEDLYSDIPIVEIPKRIIDDWIGSIFDNEFSYEQLIGVKGDINSELEKYIRNHKIKKSDAQDIRQILENHDDYILNIMEKKINNLKFNEINKLIIDINKNHNCNGYNRYNMICSIRHTKIIEMIKNIYYVNFLQTELEFRPEGKGYNEAKLRFENKDY